MSVEFRQRTAGEFIQMLKRRKWLILLPIITMTTAIGYVVYKLPSVYESTTLLTLKPPTISSNVAPSLSEEDLSQRLQTINQEVLSRSSIEPMIAKYNLFEIERNSGMDQAMIVDKMRRNIIVEPEKGDNEKVAAFRLSYRDRTPAAARNVAAELASKYVNAQVIAANQVGQVTKDFIDGELKHAKDNLDLLDKQRLGIMTQNVETLPDSQQGLIAQLTNLSNKREGLIKEKESLSIDKGRINDQISANNRQISTIESLVSKELTETAKMASRFEDTPVYAQLIQKQTELESRLKNLLLQYRDKHPEVVKTQNDLAEVKNSLESLKKNSQQKEVDAVRRGAGQTEIQKQGFLAENKRLEDNLARDDQQMGLKDQEIQQTAGEINEINNKINQIPNVKVMLEGINNQYLSAKQTYDELLKKNNDATFSASVESNALGETIRVQDAANLPQSPVAPKRAMLTGLGAAIGLAIGLFLAALFEIPRIFKIQNIEDAKHYTGLPVLASVPPLLSHEEKVWLRRSHWLRVLTGIVVAVAVIPLIALGLQATHLLEKLVS